MYDIDKMLEIESLDAVENAQKKPPRKEAIS